MIDKCKLASDRISYNGELTSASVSNILLNFDDLDVTRIIVTDSFCNVVYDSEVDGARKWQYALFPEIVTALEGNDVFYWNYHDSAMRSSAATPIFAYGKLLGCVYMMDYDTAQGTLISTLQNSILAITLVLQLILVVFSFVFSSTYSRRLRKIMSSIGVVREGDYSHKLQISGNDELNALSNEFNDLIQRLQTSENIRSQFVSDASHELNTPLASIKLLSDSILQNNMDPETINEFVGDIGKEADRLNRMSEKLLSLTRLDNLTPSDKPVTNIVPIIERTVRILSENARKNQIEVDMNLKADCWIAIPEDDMAQIIFNLVENGIKYNKKHGRLSIDLDIMDNSAVIKIADTGIGIPEESIHHIFERFYRVDKARSRLTGGSGLGLSIVKGLVEQNNGTIQANSVTGQGTIFTLRFPLYPQREETE